MCAKRAKTNKKIKKIKKARQFLQCAVVLHPKQLPLQSSESTTTVGQPAYDLSCTTYMYRVILTIFSFLLFLVFVLWLDIATVARDVGLRLYMFFMASIYIVDNLNAMYSLRTNG